MSKSFSVGNNPRIRIESVGGDLSVVGWDGTDMLVKADDDDEIRIEQTGETVSISSGSDLSLRVPKGASLEFILVGGDASIRGLTGSCEIKEIAGDFSARDCGSISIDTIQGDLALNSIKGNVFLKSGHSDAAMRDVNGNVTIETLDDDLSLRAIKGDVRVMNVDSDVSIHGVDGNVNLDSVADDLALRGVRGDVHVNVGEDAVIYLEPRGDGEYSFHAGEDILLVLPKETNATLDLRGDEILVDWKGIENEEEITERVVTLGNGAAKIILNAGGEVRVSNQANAGESADEWGNFAGLNFDWSGFGERISRQVAQATARAGKRAEEAARRAERHAERHARRWTGNVNVGRWNWDISNPPKPPAPPMPPSEPVAEEERMAILKMLAEKKITSEQAEELLKALEGGA